MKYLFDKIISKIDYDEKGKIISYLNVYNYSILRKNKIVLETVDYFTFDGFLFQYICYFLTGKLHKRLAPDFGSYGSQLFEYMDFNCESVYIIGSKTSELYKFIKLIEENYANVRIVGTQDGYFDADDEKEIVSNIIELAPNKIILGMGTPKQEQLSLKLRMVCEKSLIFNCGAFISQTANKGANYYPDYVNKLNLRWVYRIFNEKKMVKRYFVEYPKGVFYIFKDYIKKYSK